MATALVACQENPTIEVHSRGTLLDVQKIGHLELQEICTIMGDSFPDSIARYPVDYYVLTYATTYQGAPIRSQALLLLPCGAAEVNLVGYLHGAIFPENFLGANQKTPSLYRGAASNWEEVRYCGIPFATAGYCVAMPDYIGYGLTSNEEHPFVYYPELFIPNIDALLATKQYFEQQGMVYNGNLFLSGWSEGAGAALSAHQYIERNYADQFQLKGTTALAGPYNFVGFIEEVLRAPDKHFLAAGLYSWAAYSLNKFSGLKRPCDQLFLLPVYDQFTAFNILTSKPGEIFRPYFSENLLNGNDDLFRAIIVKNSFHTGWTPKAPIYLHHGTDDNVVPFFNSQDAFDQLSKRSSEVFLYEYEKGSHHSHVHSYICSSIDDFNSIRKR